MRKGIMLLIILLLTYTLGSCKYYDPVNERAREDSVYNSEYNDEIYNEIGKERWDWDDSPAEEYAVNVMDCFINEDVEGLKNLFCERVNYGNYLDEEIPKAFEFIDGNIISYDDDISCTSSVAYDEGKVSERYYGPFVDNITTDKNKVYTMNIGLFTVYEKDDRYVGVDVIVIRNSDGDKITVGFVP